MEIRFNVTGVCTQTVELNKDCPFTEKEILDSLNSQGEHLICTTIQEGGDLIWIKPGGESVTIGKVVSSQIDGDYDDFGDPDKEFLDDEDLDDEDGDPEN